MCETPQPLAGAGWGMVWLDGQRIGSARRGEGIAYSLASLSGQALPIVSLPEPSQRSGPPYGLDGPYTGHFPGE